jgi:hypothetical protein
MKFLRYPVVLSALCASTGHAHHGRDFLLLQDYSIPVPFSGVITGGFEWASQQPSDTMEMETGVFSGVAPRTGLGVNLKGGDEGTGWNFSAVAPYVQCQLTPPDARFPLRIAAIAGWNYAVTRSHDHHGHHHAPAAKTTPSATKSKPPRSTAAAPAPTPPAPAPPVACGPDYGPDAPPCDDPSATPPHDHSSHDHGTSSSHDHDSSSAHDHTDSADAHLHSAGSLTSDDILHAHRGIHQHGVNHAFARLIMEADLSTADKVLCNLIAIFPETGKPAWGYAAGYRHSFSHSFAVGMEGIGDFSPDGMHELMAGAYWSPGHRTLIRAGAGFGLTRESPDFTLRAGLVWRF